MKHRIRICFYFIIIDIIGIFMVINNFEDVAKLSHLSKKAQKSTYIKIKFFYINKFYN